MVEQGFYFLDPEKFLKNINFGAEDVCPVFSRACDYVPGGFLRRRRDSVPRLQRSYNLFQKNISGRASRIFREHRVGFLSLERGEFADHFGVRNYSDEGFEPGTYECLMFRTFVPLDIPYSNQSLPPVLTKLYCEIDSFPVLEREDVQLFWRVVPLRSDFVNILPDNYFESDNFLGHLEDFINGQLDFSDF